MKSWFKQLDAVLRGDATQVSALRDGSIGGPIGGLTGVIVLLAAAAGACMGSYAVVRLGWGGLLQVLASAVKLPLLFALTLAVTLPSLYVFNALVGSRLTVVSVLRLLVAANGVMLAVFASLGPIIIFFGLSTTSYPFMKVLNVAAAGVGGFLGLAFLLRTLHRLVLVQEANDAVAAASEAAGEDTDDGQDDLAFSVSPADGDDEPLPTPEPVHDEAGTPGEGPAAPAPSPRQQRVRQYIHGRPPTPTPEERLAALDHYAPHTPSKAKAVFRVWVLVYAVVGAQMGWVLRPFIGAPGVEFTWFRAKDSNFFLDMIETVFRLLGG